MSCKSYIVSIDIGTTFVKLGLVCTSGIFEFLAKKTIADYLGFSNLQKAWALAIKDGISELKNNYHNKYGKNPKIEYVGLCGNGPTIVSFRKGRVFEGSLVGWRTPSIGKVFEGFYISRLELLLQDKNFNNDKHDMILPCPEFIVHLMTGDYVAIIPSQDFAKHMWSKSELEKIGFNNLLLPEFQLMEDYSAAVNSAGSSMFGLEKGTQVFCVGTDFFSTLIGSGTLSQGDFCDRAGTSQGLNLCGLASEKMQGIRALPHVSEGFCNLSLVFPDSGKIYNKYQAVLMDESLFLEELEGVDFANYLSLAQAYLEKAYPLTEENVLSFFTNGIQNSNALIVYFSLYVAGFLKLESLAGGKFKSFSIAGGQASFKALNIAKASLYGSQVKVFFEPTAEVIGTAVLVLARTKGLKLYDIVQVFEKSSEIVDPSAAMTKFLAKTIKNRIIF